MVDPLRTAVRQVIEGGEATSNAKTARPSTDRTVSHVQGAPGRARKTWETAATSDNGKLIVVEGRWPLPARGQ